MAPAGWDTWGKIAVLRDGFDAAKWGEAWERDLDADAGATVPGGAKDMFKSLVGEDRGSKVSNLARKDMLKTTCLILLPHRLYLCLLW